MKHYITLIFILIIIILPSWSQQIAIENINSNTAVVGINNYLNIIVEKISCKDLIISTDNGKIEQSEDPKKDCQHIFTPKNVGIANISIYKMSYNEIILIESKKYRILPWPEQNAVLSASGKTAMTKEEFLSFQSLNVPIQGMDMTDNIPIESYEIEILRKGKIAFLLSNQGDKFSKENIITLKAIKPGDVILFKNILCYMTGEIKPRKLDDLKITIVKN